MRARADYKTCWWNYSKRCNIHTCQKCIFYISTLEGLMADKKDFVQYRRSKLSAGLAKLLSAGIKQLARKDLKVSGAVPYMDDSSRKILVEELIKAKSPLKFITGRVYGKVRNGNGHRGRKGH